MHVADSFRCSVVHTSGITPCILIDRWRGKEMRIFIILPCVGIPVLSIASPPVRRSVTWALSCSGAYTVCGSAVRAGVIASFMSGVLNPVKKKVGEERGTKVYPYHPNHQR